MQETSKATAKTPSKILAEIPAWSRSPGYIVQQSFPILAKTEQFNIMACGKTGKIWTFEYLAIWALIIITWANISSWSTIQF